MITSNARWTMIDDSQDTHDSIDEAQWVCNMLMDDHKYTACGIRGYCLKTWVEIDGVVHRQVEVTYG